MARIMETIPDETTMGFQIGLSFALSDIPDDEVREIKGAHEHFLYLIITEN